jgi:predicted cupin superfamily sugar epimerase
MTADEIAALLGMVLLPGEGGRWVQTLLDNRSSAILYLLSDGDFSAMHRLDADEIYHHYAGDPVEMLFLDSDGSVNRPVLGSDLEAGQRPQLVVPVGVWQGSSTLGLWSLLGTTMAPPYSDEGFELGKRDRLVDGWPAAAGRIEQLTR